METEYITSEGISVFHDRNESLHSFCLCLYVRAGSMFEEKKDNGISHFFEHIVFRNINKRMDGNLYQTLDRLGLEFNAATYDEMIRFIITGATAHFEEAARILTGVFAPLALSEQEIDVERNRIKAEIREDDDEGTLLYFTKRIGWKNTSLARTITGKKKPLNKIGKKRLSAFQKKALSVNNVFFYITGNYPESAPLILDRLMRKYKTGRLKKERENIAPVPKNFFHRKEKIYVKKSWQTRVCISIDIDVSRYTLAEQNLLYDILFSGDFCKIYQELSEKSGYVYSYDSFFQGYNNIGQFQLVYDVQPKNICASVETVVRVFNAMRDGIRDELAYALPFYVDNAELLMDNAGRFNWHRAYEGHILNTYYKDLSERKKSYLAVTPKRMTEICREVFVREHIILAVSGKKKKIDKKRLLSILEEIPGRGADIPAGI